MFWVRTLTTLLVLHGLVQLTTAYKMYADRIPNGKNVPHPCKPNYLWKGVGHQNELGGGARNDFGKDFLKHGATWNEDVCRADSDGDGMTNGQELGDPDCVWTPGQLPARTTGITHPGVCDPWEDATCQQTNTWVNCDLDTLHCDALDKDPDVRNITLRFPPTKVPNTETNYFCMTFDLPGDQPYHLVAYEPVIDNAYVMHHLLVYGCEGDDPPSVSEPTPCGMEATAGCNNLIAVWQVGSSGLCMTPKAGFLFGQGSFTRIKMEFHWNNPEFNDNYTDSSGIRLFYTPNLRNNSLATMMIGQQMLEIPPLQPSVEIQGSCSSDCTRRIIKDKIHVTEAVNHMHYLGIRQKVEVFRNNELHTTITNDEAYSYDAPVLHVHDPPIELLPGDEVRTTCVYDSEYKQDTTYYGEGTSDEMCFAFLSVYPKESLRQRYCVGYMEQSVCGADNDGWGDCDITTFLNYSIPEQRDFIHAVSQRCQPFQPCTAECSRLMAPLRDEPCMKGLPFERLKGYMVTDKDALLLLAKMMSCQPRPDCPSCPQCPPTPAPNNNNQDDTGDADSVMPCLFALATLLFASLIFN